MDIIFGEDNLGQEVAKNIFSQKDASQFQQKLEEETQLLVDWLKDTNTFKACPKKCGYELEGWLSDNNQKPSPTGDQLVSRISNQQITPELSKYNFEINGTPSYLKEDFIQCLKNDLSYWVEKCRDAAAESSSNAFFIGTYPCLDMNLLSNESRTPSKRFEALNDRVNELRGGPAKIHFSGQDELKLSLDSIMFEAQATSLQIHLQVAPNEAKDFYNASIIAAPLMSALCANAPYVFKKNLWAESRIPIFEQSISLYSQNSNIARVGLGGGFIDKCVSELFKQNLLFPILLPQDCGSDTNKLKHLRLHNGTVWRWNRPLIDFDDNGNPNFRVEHRVPSAGPSETDVVANIVFFIGYVHYLVKHIKEDGLPEYNHIDRQFYNCSKNGIHSRINFRDKDYSLIDFLDTFALEGVTNELTKLGLNKKQVNESVIKVIRDRAYKKQNGASWQINFTQKNNNDFYLMIDKYIENQLSNRPVSEWSL